MADQNSRFIISAVDNTAAAFRSVATGVKNLENSFSVLNTIAGRLPMLGGALAAALGGASFTAIIKSTIDFADHLGDLSKSTGVSVGTLAQFKLAAEQSGTSLEAVAKGIQKLSKNLVENEDKFKAAGISTKDAKTAFLQLSDVFKSLDDNDPKKVALALQLMGKSGAELIPLMNGGSKAMQAMLDQSAELAEKYAELQPKADQFNDSLAKLKIYGESVAIDVATPYVDAFNRIGEAMDKAAKRGDQLETAWRIFKDMNIALGANMLKMVTPDSFAKTIDEHVANQLAYDNRLNDFPARDTGIKKISGLKPTIPPPQANAAAILLGKTPGAASDSLGDWMDSKMQRWIEEEQRKLEQQARAQTAAARIVTDLGKGFGRENDSALRAQMVMPESLRQTLDSLAKVSEQADRAREQVNTLFAQGHLSATIYNETLGKITAQEVQQAETVHLLAAQQDKLSASWEYGANRAIQSYADSLQNVAALSERAFTSAFSGAEDAVVKFVQTGKLDLKSLFDQIEADLIRIALRQAIIKPLANSLFGGESGGIGSLASVMNMPTADWLPSFAVGTDYVPRDMVAKIHRGERIVPAAQNSSGIGGITNNFYITGAADMRTQQQIAAVAGMAVRRALARNT
ncbi:conserved protein of unknown function [Georgfuchsia toluolica]|uniref:Bacteriophage tail tape measure C-terminal domain-containing protein n=1 Tax=Georgfuchsia toluolica TaxID=424218 RepID=A0A916J4M1_9PROT|nr:phage tail tape measure C-terminal domain-containing protein [Georgfuchsia toluolica]CAG4883805.1 conserved protein of unknown function [Georgfuchsia toluolica]